MSSAKIEIGVSAGAKHKRMFFQQLTQMNARNLLLANGWASIDRNHVGYKEERSSTKWFVEPFSNNQRWISFVSATTKIVHGKLCLHIA